MTDPNTLVIPYPLRLRPDLHHFFSLPPEDLLALLILGEAEGEPYGGKLGVGWVVRNRVENPCWWGSDYQTVILCTSQFSCFNQGVGSRLPLLNDPYGSSHVVSQRTKVAYNDCIQAAEEVLIAPPGADITQGADHYFAKDMKTWTSWIENMMRTVDIGRHVFFSMFGSS